VTEVETRQETEWSHSR